MNAAADSAVEVLHAPRKYWSLEVVSRNRGGRSEVVKRPPRDARGLRRVFCRWILRREATMLAALGEKAPEVSPRVLAYERDGLVLERLDGLDLAVERPQPQDHARIDRDLNELVDRLHRAGFAHGEIRLGNLVRHRGRLRLVDLATACSASHPLFRTLRLFDLFAVARIGEDLLGRHPDTKARLLSERHVLTHALFRITLARGIAFR